MSDQFVMDARLANDTAVVADLALSRVVLMDDARFPWLILIPRKAGAVEILDLDAQDQARLMQEIAQSATALRAVTSCDKLNIAALGNLVPQLHVHVIARFRDDPAWPRPVWGHGNPQPYAIDARDQCVRRLRAELLGPSTAP